jgi:hypothetical protein
MPAALGRRLVEFSFSLGSRYTVDMTTTVLAHFDGKVFVPDEPVDVPVGTPLRVRVEALNEAMATPPSAPSPAQVTPAPRRFQPLNIQIDPELSHAIALDPAFNIEES